jgi:hypothetical protein
MKQQAYSILQLSIHLSGYRSLSYFMPSSNGEVTWPRPTVSFHYLSCPCQGRATALSSLRPSPPHTSTKGYIYVVNNSPIERNHQSKLLCTLSQPRTPSAPGRSPLSLESGCVSNDLLVFCKQTKIYPRKEVKSYLPLDRDTGPLLWASGLPATAALVFMLFRCGSRIRPPRKGVCVQNTQTKSFGTRLVSSPKH